jgi:microcystin-dependent protein
MPTRRTFYTILGAGLLAAGAALAVPHTFEPNTPLSAGKMNANFEALEARIAALEGAREIPAGTVTAFAGGGDSPPSGWLWCDGQAVSKNEFPDLFAAIGTVHGGTGNPMFQVPDYRGLFLRGLDEGAGRDAQTGRELGSVQADAFQGHWHVHAYKLAGVAFEGAGVSVPHWEYSQAGSDTNSIQDPVEDGRNGAPRVATETRPKNAAVRYLIKY